MSEVFHSRFLRFLSKKMSENSYNVELSVIFILSGYHFSDILILRLQRNVLKFVPPSTILKYFSDIFTRNQTEDHNNNNL